MYEGATSKEFPLQNYEQDQCGGIEAKGKVGHEEMNLLISTHLLSWQLCNRAKIMNCSFGGKYLYVLIFPASGRASYLLFDQTKSKSLSGSRTNK